MITDPREDQAPFLERCLQLRYPESRIGHSLSLLAASREWGHTKTSAADGRDAAEARRVLSRPGRVPPA